MDFQISIPQQQEGRETFVLEHADGTRETIDYYDYDRVYAIPGLAMVLRRKFFHSHSDWVLSAAMLDTFQREGAERADIRLLDFGAGSGCFGHEARQAGIGYIVGADIVAEAKTEALRQHPEAYDEYFVMDIRETQQQKKLKELNLNTLVAINALGREHVSKEIFLAALECIQKPGWIVFNVMAEQNQTIEAQERDWFCEAFEVVDHFRFFHRTSIDGRERYFNEGYVCRW